MRIQLIILALGLPFAVCSAQAQGTFQNLNFEQANPVGAGTGFPNVVTVASAFPYWTPYLGATPQTEVLQNAYTTGAASVDIFGPDYPAAGWPPVPFNPGVIDGSYSVLLQPGADVATGGLVSASIAQTGTLSPGTQSVEFEAWATSITQFAVSFNGNVLSPVMIGAGPNYILYGANISPSYGSSGQLDFTAFFVGQGASMLGLDDISFSTTSVVPEPSPLVLAGLGGLVFAYRRFQER